MSDKRSRESDRLPSVTSFRLFAIFSFASSSRGFIAASTLMAFSVGYARIGHESAKFLLRLNSWIML